MIEPTAFMLEREECEGVHLKSELTPGGLRKAKLKE